MKRIDRPRFSVSFETRSLPALTRSYSRHPSHGPLFSVLCSLFSVL